MQPLCPSCSSSGLVQAWSVLQGVREIPNSRGNLPTPVGVADWNRLPIAALLAAFSGKPRDAYRDADSRSTRPGMQVAALESYVAICARRSGPRYFLGVVLRAAHLFHCSDAPRDI